MEDLNKEVIYEAEGFESLAYETGEGDYTVAVIGQNHGDERGPVEIFEDLLHELVERYDGLELVFIPEANVFASGVTERKTPLDLQPNRADQRDLNRSYETARRELSSENPDLQALNLTQQAAFNVLSYLEYLEPDLVLDMHSGTSGTTKMPQVRYKYSEDFPVEEDEMRDLALNAGVDFLSSEPGVDAEMLGAVAPKTGFPTLTLEVGGGVEHGYRGSFEGGESERCREILENIFSYALRDQETGFDPLEFTELEKNHTPMDFPEGELEYHFDLGELVVEGETVATLRNGDQEYDIHANSDGTLETVLTEDARESVKPGNRVFNLALREN